jgi:hypothetical protein
LRIDVSGTGNASLTIDRQTTGAESKILLLDGNVSQWGIAAKAASNNFVIRDADSTERFTILKSGGNVGIGTTNPNYKLHVEGTSFFNNTISSSGKLIIESTQPGIILRETDQIGTTHRWIDVESGTFRILQTNNDYSSFTTQFVINSSGNVGIGTTSPTARLHVSGSTGGVFEVDTAGGTTTFYVSASGNVGIGTTSPADKLSVISGSVRIASSSLAGALYLGNDGNNIYLERDNNYDLSLVQNGDSNRALYLASAGNVYVNIDSNNNDTDKAFIVQNNALKAGTELFRVSETGNVGIGTSIPNNKLDIFGGTGTTLNMSNVDDGNRGGKLTFISSSATGRQFYVGTNSSIYNLVFGIDSIEKARIDTNGNLGIGITSPTVRLHVSGSSIITNPNPGANSAVLLVQDDGTATTVKDGTTLRVVNDGSAGNFSVFEASSGVSDFVILNNGNVGIGTSSPVAKLQVAGNVSGSSFTSSISNAVGFLGTSSWATNAVTASFVPNAFVQGGNSFGTTALLGTNDANSLAFETNGSTRMTINSGGQVGIGGFPVSHYKTYIADTHRGSLGSSSLWIDTAQNQNQGLATSANDSGITNVYTVNNFTSSAAIQNQASFNQMIIAGSGSFSGSYRAERNGILFTNTASLDSSGNIVNTYLTNQISSNIPTFSIPNWVAGTQTYVDLITGNSTGSITNLYNHQISSPFPSGGSGGITVTNSYGIYIAKQKTTNIVTNGWGIYQIDTGDLNIFAGKTRIGSTTVPVNTLDVTGNISASVITASLFFGTASWANSVVSASFATTAQTANALNSANSYTITNLTASNISASATGSFGIVGIGTNSPAYKLDVNGSVYGSNYFTLLTAATYGPSDNSAAMQVFGSTGSGGLTNTIKFVTGGSERWRITDTGILQSPAGQTIQTSTGNLTLATAGGNGHILLSPNGSGNVGIGTTTPSTKLAVEGGSVSTVNITGSDVRYSFDIRTLVGGAIGFNNAAASNVYGAVTGSAYFGVAQSYPIVFTTAGTERMRIESGGNVGIGTTVPNAKFDVRPDSSWIGSEAVIIDTDGGNNPRIKLYRPDGASATSSYAIHLRNDSGNLNILNTGVNATLGSETVTSKFYINTVGNVGIGTTNPVAKLQVVGNISGSSFTSSVSNAVGFLGTASWAQNVVTASYLVPTNSYTITNLTASNIGVSGTSSFGYVGIGTTNPTYKLDLQPTSSVARFGQATVGAFPANSSVFAFFGHTNLDNINTAANYALLQSSNGDTFLNASSGRNVYFRIANSDKMLLNSSGQVSIGTTVPVTGFLDVRSNVTKSVVGPTNIAFFGSSDGGNPLGLAINHESSSGVKMIGLVGTEYGLSGNNIKINETLHVQYTGNVGLNTITPNSKLSINGSPTSDNTFTYLMNLLNTDSTITAGMGSGISFGSNINSGGGNNIAHLCGIIGIKENATSGNYASALTFWTRINGAASAERVRIDSSGNVGIGTTSPATKLDVKGNVFVANAANGNNTIAFGNIGGLGPLNGAPDNLTGSAFLVVSSSTASGAPSHMKFFTTTGGTCGERMRIDESGNIGMGTIAPNAKLQVVGNISGTSFTSSISNAVGFLGTSSWAQNVVSASFATTAQTANALNASNTYTIAGLTSAYVDVNGSSAPTTGIYRPSTKTLGLSADSTLIFKISNVSAPATSSIETGNFLVQTGNVGIGTTNPTDKLTVYGALASYKTGADTIQTQVYLANGGNTRAFNIQLNSGGTGLDLWSYNSANAWLRHTTFDYDGRVGIGTAAPVAKFEISGSSNSALMNIKSPISGAILYVSGSGAVGIGTSNVGAFTLQVNGSFGATTKSFIIDHPTKAGKKLMYGSLESPYHGIRLTGRDTLVNGKCKIQLPDYMYKLILHDSVNIQLTGIKCNKTLYVDEINIPENYFTIAYDKAIFESYKDYDFFWDFTAIRADVPELITEL